MVPIIENSSSIITGQLASAFANLNTRFFHGELKMPHIIAQARGKAKRDCWSSEEPVWFKNNPSSPGEEAGLYEFVICEDMLSKSPEELSMAMLAEMVHMHNRINSISDSTRGGNYNNERYKEEAEKRGLVVEKNPQYGYVATGLTEEAAEYIHGLNIQFDYCRKPRPAKAPPAHSHKEKHCPNCGALL